MADFVIINGKRVRLPEPDKPAEAESNGQQQRPKKPKLKKGV